MDLHGLGGWGRSFNGFRPTKIRSVLSKSVARWFSLGDLFQVGFSAVHSCGNYFVFDFVGLRLHISSSCMAFSMLLSHKSPICFWYGLAAHPALICFAQKLCPVKTRQHNQKKQLKRAGTTACMSVHILLKLKQRQTTKYSKKRTLHHGAVANPSNKQGR